MVPETDDDRSMDSPTASNTHLEYPMSNHPFTIIDHEQGTEAWHDWRRFGIGASDAPVIMGENRFKKLGQLLLEKKGGVREFRQSQAMALGTQLEPVARQLYISQTQRNVLPACLQSTRYPWLRASVDGLDLDSSTVVEIKCGASSYRTTLLTGMVPNHYYGQLQHILAVTEFEAIDFYCYWPESQPVLRRVPRSEPYIARLLEAEAAFWDRVAETNDVGLNGSSQTLP